MFNIKKFGGSFYELRKKNQLTKHYIANKLNVTSHAISLYECGDSFPDVSILVSIANLFNISLSELINFGNPSIGENLILTNIALGNDIEKNIDINDLINLAPLLKPSQLEKLSKKINNDEINISKIIELAVYLNNESIINILERVSLSNAHTKCIDKLIAFFYNNSIESITNIISQEKNEYHLSNTLKEYTSDPLKIENKSINNYMLLKETKK